MKKVPTSDSSWFEIRAGKSQLDSPGIYAWHIEGADGYRGIYIGKATKIVDRMRAYPKNVQKILKGEPYHGDRSKDYRRVHHKLTEALQFRMQVTFEVVEECPPEHLDERESHWIDHWRESEARGNVEVLNGTRWAKSSKYGKDHQVVSRAPHNNRQLGHEIESIENGTRPEADLQMEWCKIGAKGDELKGAGVYEWRVGDECVYVGKSGHLETQLTRYKRKVRSLLDRQGPIGELGDGIRGVHIQIAKAVRSGGVVQFNVLEVCDPDLLQKRKKAWQAQMNIGSG